MSSGGFASYAGLVGHEMKHGFQFETGEISISTTGYGALYDIGDETAAYNRELMISQSFNEYRGPVRTNTWTRSYGATMTPPAYQTLSANSKSLSTRAGIRLISSTILAGSQGKSINDYYKGWQRTYNASKVK